MLQGTSFSASSVNHWHGATDSTTMMHMAIQESNSKGENVNWLEKVSDKQSLQAV